MNFYGKKNPIQIKKSDFLIFIKKSRFISTLLLVPNGEN